METTWRNPRIGAIVPTLRDPRPSSDDIHITRRLVEAGALLGVEVLDHLIVGDARYHSFRQSGGL